MSKSRCLCGHAWGLHRHYRAGTDCAMCYCPRFFRPVGLDWRWVAGAGVVGWLAAWASHPGILGAAVIGVLVGFLVAGAQYAVFRYRLASWYRQRGEQE